MGIEQSQRGGGGAGGPGPLWTPGLSLQGGAQVHGFKS